MVKGLLKPADSKGKLVKKIKVDKFVSKPREGDRRRSSIVKSEVSSLVSRPSSKLAPKVILPSVKETKVPKGKVSFDFLNGILDSLVKNTSSLLKISKSEYKSESKNAEVERRSDQLEKKRQREESVETRSRSRDEGKSLKIAAPKLPLFDGAFEFLKKFAIGTAVMQVLSILSDPKKKDSIIGFLTNNMEVILLGMVGIMGALILAPFTPLLGAFGILFNVTAALVGSLVSLLLNPVVLPAVGIAVAALAGRAAFYKYALPKIAPFVNNLITANIKRMYGVGNSKKGVFITKLRDQYGRIATKADYDKMTADEKSTAQFLSMYDDELQNRQKINDALYNERKSLFKNPSKIKKLQDDLSESDQKIRMLEDQIVVQGIKLLELQDLYETTGVLPETSLSKRLYPSTKQKKFDGPSSTTKPSSTFTFPNIFGMGSSLFGGSSTSQPQTTAVSQPASLSTGMGTMTGLLTGHGGGTPFHVDTRWARDLPMDIVVPMIDSMAAILAAEGRVMEMGSAGSVSGKRYPVNGTFDEKKRFLENATAGHHTQRSMAAFDYFIPKSGETRFGKSAEYANIPAPALPPGYKISFHSGSAQNGGAFYQITDQNGKVVFKTFHGDPSRSTLSLIGQKNVLTSTPSSIAQYAPYEQPAETPALIPVSTPTQNNQRQMASATDTPLPAPVSEFQVLNTYYNFQVLGFLYKQG